MKRVVGTLILSIPILASIAGCTGSGEPRNPGAEDGGRKILRIARRSEHKSLDPAAQFDSASAQIVSNVYDTLLEYDYLRRPYALVPGLLEKMPERQADGVTYLFTLRRGVRFIDDPAFPDGRGREVTIDDVMFSIKRFADANVNAKSFVLMQGVVQGLDEFREATRQQGRSIDYEAHDVTGLQRLDAQRMLVRFTGENPLALYPFAASPMSIVAKEAVAHYGGAFSEHPVGTGPFILRANDRRGTMVLVKNPNYHGRYPRAGLPEAAPRSLLEDAGKSLPLVDEVHLPLIEESQPAMLRFRRGELDLHTVDRDNFIKMVDRDDRGRFQLKSPYREHFRMYAEEALTCEYIAFNMNDPLVGKNRALRQAIAHALDVEAFIEIMLNGRAEPLATIVPHPIAGSERDISIEYHAHDRDKARAKLAEAGYPEGVGLPTIHFDFRSTTKEARQGFEFLRYELAVVGIRAVGRFHTFSAYLQRIESGNFQVGNSGWSADYPDAGNFYQLLYSVNRPPGPNMGAFADPEYDRLYEETRFMPNGPERFAKFERMAVIVRDETPIILRFNRLDFAVYQKRLRNVMGHMMNDAPYKFLNMDVGDGGEG
jgi:ABC-type transport system substrate-binding protein